MLNFICQLLEGLPDVFMVNTYIGKTICETPSHIEGLYMVGCIRRMLHCSCEVSSPLQIICIE